MKKTIVRVVSLALALTMVLGLMTGCGKKKKTPVATGDGTLTVGIPQKASVSDYDDNALTQYIEEKLGIDIEFVYFSSNTTEYKQQLTLMAGSGETLPDVIVGFNGLSHYAVNQFGEDGYFIDLTDLIDEYGENYKAQLKKLPKEQQKYLEEKGKNTKTGERYAMPMVECEAIDQLQSMMYINKKWLDKLGLPIPKTTEELYNTLIAFRDKDPNGNGMPDEIPMLGKNAIMNYLINAYVAYDENNFNVTKGKVWDPVKTEEFRQALSWANKLVNEKLYSDLSFTISSNTEYKTLISPVDGPSKVGIFCGHHETMTNAATNALDEFVALPALGDATGKGGYTMSAPAGVHWAGYITKDCDDVVTAMRFMDLFYEDETVTRQRHGAEGTDWVREEGKNAYGTASYAKAINSEAFFSGNATWCTNMLGILTDYNYLLVAQKGEGRIAQASRLQTEQWNIKKNGKTPKEEAVDLVYTTEEYEVREEKASTVNAYVNEQVTLFVRGEQNVNDDNAWNTFLKTLDKIGRVDLMKVAQSAYKRK